MQRFAAIAALLFPLAAAADSFSGYVEENLQSSKLELTDSTGATSAQDGWQWTQRYRLALDKTLWPTLRLNAGGLFERTLGDTTGDFQTSLVARDWNGYGNLLWTLQTLQLAVGYQRREAYGAGSLGLLHDEYTLLANFRPEGLPWLFLRLARPHTFDSTGAAQDLLSHDGLFSATWKPIRPLDLGYSVSYTNPRDEVRGSDSTSWLQTANVLYSDRLFGGRSQVSLSAQGNRRITEVRSSGNGGTFETLQAPIGGFSLVETGAATRARDKLLANSALINGDLVASSGVNLGTNASTPTDDFVDIGAQFADAATTVNTFYVWVDRDLTVEVAQALQFEVWKSDDNDTWVQVPVVKQFPAQFVTLQDRFEITVPDTQSRYLKVVTKPVTSSVTTDPRFKDVFVTELQLVWIRPLPGNRQVDTANGSVLSASARTMIVQSINLAHDFSLYVTTQQRPRLDTAVVWLVLNGLSASRQLNETWLASARVARQDANQLRGHEGTFLYSASLAATPRPTLTGSLVYSGQNQTVREGTLNTNALSLFTQMTPYQGIGLSGNLTYSIADNLAQQTLTTDAATITATLQPHPRLGFSGSFAHTATVSEGGGLPRSTLLNNRIDGTVTFTPVRALFASITATRLIQAPANVTLANAALSFNPFPGGDLQFGGSYNETLDADDSRTRFFGPFVRWNIRRGTVLNVNYTILDIDRHALGGQHTKTLAANLAIPL